MTRRRKKRRPNEILAKLRDADAILTAGKDLAAMLQALEVSDSTLERSRAQYGGMKCEEAKRLKHLKDENRRLNQLVVDLSLDNQMPSTSRTETGKSFPEASGGRRASHEVWHLRAKGMHGG